MNKKAGVRNQKKCKGQAMTEFVLAFPTFFTVMLASMQFFSYTYQLTSLYYAANEGARAAVTSPVLGPSQVKQAVSDAVAVALKHHPMEYELGPIEIPRDEVLPITVTLTAKSHAALTAIVPGLDRLTVRASAYRSQMGEPRSVPLRTS